MPLNVPDQPHCLLVHPVDEPLTSADDDVPIEFSSTPRNVGCTVNSARSRITVPDDGTYLVTACVGGDKTNAGNSGDGIKFFMMVNGSQPVHGGAFPLGTFGVNQGDEFHFNFSFPVFLSANDYVEIAVNNVDDSRGTIKHGYLSVTKLH